MLGVARFQPVVSTATHGGMVALKNIVPKDHGAIVDVGKYAAAQSALVVPYFAVAEGQICGMDAAALVAEVVGDGAVLYNAVKTEKTVDTATAGPSLVVGNGAMLKIVTSQYFGVRAAACIGCPVVRLQAVAQQGATFHQINAAAPIARQFIAGDKQVTGDFVPAVANGKAA